MPRRQLVSSDVRALLESAGYIWTKDADSWSHPRLQRELNVDVAAIMTAEQVKEWIAAGQGREPPA